MGGMIQFVFRDQDGSVHKRLTWTNCMPYVLTDPGIYRYNRAVIDEILNEPNIYDAPEKENRIAPNGYGLIVLDWKLNKLYSCNGYSYFGFLSGFNFTVPEYSSEEEEINGQFNQLAKDNRILAGCVFSIDSPPHAVEFSDKVDLKGNSLEEIRSKLKAFSKKHNVHYVRIDLSPIQVSCFSDNSFGYQAMRKIMKEDGFVLGKGWSKFTK